MTARFAIALAALFVAPLAVASLAVSASGCIATLSEPHSEEHIAAMHDATRHYHHGRIDEAADAWDRAATTADRRVDRDEAEYRRARALRRVGRPREAIAMLDAIAERRPISRRTIRARFDAALERIELGEVDEAHASLLWIVRERPGDGPAGRSLLILLAARAEQPPEERIRFLQELYELVNDSDLGDDLLMEQAHILRAEGDLDGTVAVLEELVETFPYLNGQRWDDALVRLADIAEERGQYERALGYLEQLVRVQSLAANPGSYTMASMPVASLRMARIHRDHTGDLDAAEARFRSTISDFPTSILRDDALFELGAMWLDHGRPNDGCAILREVLETFEVGHARRLAARRTEADCAD